MVAVVALVCLALSFCGRATAATTQAISSAAYPTQWDLHPQASRSVSRDAWQLSRIGDVFLHLAKPHGGHGDHGHESHDSHGHDSHGHDPHGHDDHEHAAPPDSIAHDHSGHTQHWKCDGEGHCQRMHGDTTGISVAIGLVATVVLVPLVLYMALTDWALAELTLKMVDTFVSIFLAILWFSAFNQILETTGAGKSWHHVKEIAAFVQVLLLYGVALLIAHYWRDEHMKMSTFCTCGAHYIAFAGIAAAGILQEGASQAVGSAVGDSSEPVMSFGFCFIVIAFIGLVSFLNYISWRKGLMHEKLNHSIEEMELDMTGLIASFLITQAVRHALTGQYPALHGHFLFLQADPGKSHMDILAKDDGHHEDHDIDIGGHHVHVKHEAWQRFFMLGWALTLTGLAAFLIPWLSKRQARWSEGEGGKWAKRGVRLIKVVLIMLVAWGYLLWAQWEFFENLFVGDQMFGHMVFAVGATLTSLCILYILASVQGRVTSAEARESNTITMTGISLVTAWSWEHCFNVAFDVIGEEFEVGYGGLVPKLAMALGIPCVLLPTYVKHVRKRVMLYEEQQEEEERLQEEKHRQVHLEKLQQKELEEGMLDRISQRVKTCPA